MGLSTSIINSLKNIYGDFNICVDKKCSLLEMALGPGGSLFIASCWLMEAGNIIGFLLFSIVSSGIVYVFGLEIR